MRLASRLLGLVRQAVPESPPIAGRKRSAQGLHSLLARIAGVTLVSAGCIAAGWWLWEFAVKDIVFEISQQAAGEQAQADLAAQWTNDGFPDEPFLVSEPTNQEVFAAIIIPALGDRYVRAIASGTSQDVLDSPTLGVGHYPSTQLPAELGNFALAAHRDGHGASFRHIDRLEPGTPVYIETISGWSEYRVRSSEVVEPVDTHVLAPVPGHFGTAPDVRVLTFTTCHPRYSTDERLIVYADFVAWHSRFDGNPLDVRQDDAAGPNNLGDGTTALQNHHELWSQREPSLHIM